MKSPALKSVDSQKAYLIDTTICIGCRACQVSCKQWNELPAEKNTLFDSKTGSYLNNGKMSGKTFTVINYYEVAGKDGKIEDWVFRKDQCQHCLEPACVSACIVQALKKTEEGPVVWDSNRCVGCRYCMIACPYEIPKFEWNSAIPDIKKCTLCYDRIKEGLVPACAKTCPSGAIKFGERGELIKIAEKRIKDNPQQYHDHIYGRYEVGGTNVLYLSRYPLENLGYPKNLPTQPLEAKTAPAMHAIPGVVLGLSVLLGATSFVINKRMENQELEKKEKKHGSKD